jgi:hypothetical protein
MPDTLDDRLEAAREALRREIQRPELSLVRARAARIRRRRSAGGAVAAALALALLAGLVPAVLTAGRGGPVPEPAASASGTDRWQGAGLRVGGLDGPVLELPGSLLDVQFADADRGYALAAECTAGTCHVGLAATSDGGHSWRGLNPPASYLWTTGEPAVVAGANGVFLLTSKGILYQQSDVDGWTDPGAPAAAETIGRGSAVRVGECGGPLEVYRADGHRAELTTGPAMTVCSVTAAPGAGGAWWAGGRASDGGAPAVAVSRDDGRTWTVTRLPDGPGTARVTTLGNRVFAAVVSARGGDPYPETETLHAVYRSVDSGPFAAYLHGPATVLGDVVPLLDGRLLVAGPDWQVSQAAGGALARVGDALPWVRRIVRTPGAWVAYDLFRGGWVAVSTDGQDWQKANLH